MLIIPKIIRFI